MSAACTPDPRCSGISGFSMGVTASASAARGKADGIDVTFTNTHVETVRQLTLQSGGDTVGYSASGSLCASQAKVNSNYASVTEQSSLRAWNGG